MQVRLNGAWMIRSCRKCLGAMLRLTSTDQSSVFDKSRRQGGEAKVIIPRSLFKFSSGRNACGWFSTVFERAAVFCKSAGATFPGNSCSRTLSTILTAAPRPPSSYRCTTLYWIDATGIFLLGYSLYRILNCCAHVLCAWISLWKMHGVVLLCWRIR